MAGRMKAGWRAAFGAIGLAVLIMPAGPIMPVQASEAELCIKARMWEKISRPDATRVCSCISQTVSNTDVSDDDKA